MAYCPKCHTHFPNIQFHYCGGEEMRRWDWNDPRPTYTAEYVPPPPPQTVVYLDPPKKDYAEPAPFDPNKSSARLDILLFTILGLIIVASTLITWRLIPEIM